MESLLIGVTLVSLGLAVIMSIVAWTLLRHERQRAAARVEALEALAFSDNAPAATPRAPRAPSVTSSTLTAPANDREGAVRPSAAPPPTWDLALRDHAIDDSDRRADAMHPARHSTQLTHAELFETAPAPGVAGRRWLAAAAVALLVSAGIATLSAVRSSELWSMSPMAFRSGPSEQQPLELLSLRHSTDSDGTFTVMGLVQNPRTGVDLQGLEAVVYLFDDTDHFFASGRATVDVPNLQAGDESPFVVKVAGASGVGRYRVGFRQTNGRVVAHVDRRGQPPAGMTGNNLQNDVSDARPAGGMTPMDGGQSR